MMITMTKSDLSPSLPRSAHYDSAKLMEVNFPSYPSAFLKDPLECSSMAITCQCLFHSIASTWCVHQRHRLLPAPPIWSVPGPWTCVRNLFHTLCDWLPAPQPVFHSGSTLFSSWWIMIYDAVVKVWLDFFLQLWNLYKTIEEDDDEDQVVDGHDFQRWLSIKTLIMPFGHLAFSSLACLPLILMLRCDGKMGELWFYNCLKGGGLPFCRLLSSLNLDIFKQKFLEEW